MALSIDAGLAALKRRARNSQLRGDLARAARARSFANSIFTYDNQAFQDGMGSQLQRMYGVYALARALGAAYLHSPLAALKFAGVSTPNTAEAVGGLIDRTNQQFRLPSDSGAQDRAAEAKVVTVGDFRVARERRLIASSIPTLFRIGFPHRHLDADPQLWSVVAAASGMGPTAREPLRVALHVRRGELHFVDSHRLLPNAYYLAVAGRLRQLLSKAGIRSRFELYTESFAIPQIVKREQFHVQIGAKDEVLTPDLDRLEEFDALEPIERHINTDAAETLERLATADVLVTSRSSFSLVAGILAPLKLVLFAPFWHSPMPGWLPTKANGAFDENMALVRVNSLLGRSG